MGFELVSQSHPDNSALRAEYLHKLFRRHVQGAYVRSGAGLVMWLFVLGASLFGIIKINQFAGISSSVAYPVLINPPTLWMMKRSTQISSYKYLSILIHTLEAIGYTAIIYFLGGIESAYLIALYGALITYVGIVATRNLPCLVASICVICFTLNES